MSCARITWEIEFDVGDVKVDAKDSLGTATRYAKKALASIRRKGSIAHVFKVKTGRRTHVIDLNYPEKSR